jgi:endoglucanase
MDSTKKEIFLIFSAHEFGEGGEVIRRTLRRYGIRGSFFFTGDFYRNPKFRPLIRRLIRGGHYLGPHSDKHLLHAAWEHRDSTLVTREEFLNDLHENYRAMKTFGISKSSATVYLSPYEWYNREVADWCRDDGIQIVNMTPASITNADYTTPDMGTSYAGTDTILVRILRKERESVSGLNGYILLVHGGTDPRRTDKLYNKLDRLIAELKQRGYSFRRFFK